MTGATSEAKDLASKDEVKGNNSARQMDESGLGPKRAVAEAKAIARPLKNQPGIHSTEDSSSKRPVARV